MYKVVAIDYDMLKKDLFNSRPLYGRKTILKKFFFKCRANKFAKTLRQRVENSYDDIKILVEKA